MLSRVLGESRLKVTRKATLTVLCPYLLAV